MLHARRDFFRERFTRAELAAVLTRAGLSPRDALSKRSRAYKELGLAGRAVSDNELLELMIAEPTLLRRPLVVGDETVLGFDRDALGRLAARSQTGSGAK